MTRKPVLSTILLGISLALLTACSTVSSVSPSSPGHGNQLHSLCNTPQQPGCG